MDLGPDATATAIVPVLSCVLNQLCTRNDRLPVNQKGISKFHALRPPAITIKDYLQRIAKYASCSGECFVLSLVYIDRIIQSNPTFVVNSLNIHRLLITSVMLAAKFFDDQYFNNAYFAKVGGVPATEMNSLEVEFLFMTNFTLFVATDTYRQYYTELCNHAANGTCGCATTKVPTLELEFEDAISTPINSPLISPDHSSSSSSSSSSGAEFTALVNASGLASQQTLSPALIAASSSTFVSASHVIGSQQQPSQPQPQPQPQPQQSNAVIGSNNNSTNNGVIHMATSTTPFAKPHNQRPHASSFSFSFSSSAATTTASSVGTQPHFSTPATSSSAASSSLVAVDDKMSDDADETISSSFNPNKSATHPLIINPAKKRLSSGGGSHLTSSTTHHPTTASSVPYPSGDSMMPTVVNNPYPRSYPEGLQASALTASLHHDGTNVFAQPSVTPIVTTTVSSSVNGVGPVPVFTRQHSAPLPSSFQQQQQQQHFAQAQFLYAQQQQQAQAAAMMMQHASTNNVFPFYQSFVADMNNGVPSAYRGPTGPGVNGVNNNNVNPALFTRGDTRGAVRRFPSMGNASMAQVPNAASANFMQIPVQGPTTTQQQSSASVSSRRSHNHPTAAMITGSPVATAGSPPVDVM